MPTHSASTQPVERALITVSRALLTLPLPTAGEELSLLHALADQLRNCVPLTCLVMRTCRGSQPDNIPLPISGEHAETQDADTLVAMANQLSAEEGWCQVRITHGPLQGIIARTEPRQAARLQYLLDIYALHTSHLQTDQQLTLASSPLINRIPFWQEKIDSFTRLLRLATSLPARQLFAQLESTLRFWMSAQTVLLIQRREQGPAVIYGQTPDPDTSVELARLLQPQPVQFEQGCQFWYSFPILLHRQHHASIALALPRPLVSEDQHLMQFITEQGGILGELYALRQQQKSTPPVTEPPPVQRLQRINLRLQRQLRQRDEINRLLQQDAQRDPLTGLANRALFMHRLDHAIKHYQRYPQDGFAILMLELVSLHQVNDQLGDTQGDLLLRSVAQLLRLSTRQNDLVARLSGNEFIMLLDASASTDAITPVISRLLAHLTQPLLLGGQEITLHANLGIATISADIHEPAQLLRQADLATYQARRRGLNQAVFYSELCDMPDRLSPEQTLQQAIEAKRILPYVQPVYRMQDGRLRQLEIMARLLDENGHIQEAVTFIPLAEQSELIVQIDHMMLHHACGLLNGLLAPLVQQFDLRISINLSGKHLASTETVQALLAIIQQHDTAPQRLIFEFRERDLMRRDSQTLTLLHDLRARGIGIAVDDFGTGFGSLNALFHYPVDFIKIDDSFTHRLLYSPRDRALVRAILEISRDLGMQVVAEGVEEAPQLQMLQELRCDLAQGNFYATPLPPDAALALLRGKGSPTADSR